MVPSEYCNTAEWVSSLDVTCHSAIAGKDNTAVANMMAVAAVLVFIGIAPLVLVTWK
jgi:hypothetical protein